MLLFTEFRKFILICLCLCLTLIGTKAMVEMPNHFALIERQACFTSFVKSVTFELPTISLQLLAGAEQVRVIRHMKQCRKFEFPWILFGMAIFDQHRFTRVDSFRQFHITL